GGTHMRPGSQCLPRIFAWVGLIGTLSSISIGCGSSYSPSSTNAPTPGPTTSTPIPAPSGNSANASTATVFLIAEGSSALPSGTVSVNANAEDGRGTLQVLAGQPSSSYEVRFCFDADN